eukprot:366131-Chlamydomonas_euryale.AAC.13
MSGRGRGRGGFGGRGGGRGGPPAGPVARDDDGTVLSSAPLGPPPVFPVSGLGSGSGSRGCMHVFLVGLSGTLLPDKLGPHRC